VQTYNNFDNFAHALFEFKEKSAHINSKNAPYKCGTLAIGLFLCYSNQKTAAKLSCRKGVTI
jgi:hypothetical protein